MADRSSNYFVEKQLDACAQNIQRRLQGDLLAFVGPIQGGVDDLIRGAIDSISPKKDRLIVILETPGGYAEVTQRIADWMRKNYKLVDFVVPNYAFSAGTILVMCGDTIYMDDYSVLGPIDPQVEGKNGRMVPALGYLKRYDQLIEKSKNGNITTAEMAILVEAFDQAELYKYEQEKNLSRTLLGEWLVNYKFKDWNQTRDRGLPVTQEMKEERAAWIADQLQEVDKWHVHGRGIRKDVLEKEINLIIDDFSKDSGLSAAIKDYHTLLLDYMSVLRLASAIHTRKRFVPIERMRPND